MDGRQINPRRRQSYNSMASTQCTPKQYRVLGLANKASSSTFAPSVKSASTGTTACTPQFKPRTQTLSDNLSILIQHMTTYFDLFDRLPHALIDRNLRMEKPTDTFSAYHQMETDLSKCLLGIRDTLWSIQTQLKDENAFVRKIFRGFESQLKKYLTRCLKGWRSMLLIRSCVRHYRAVSNIRRILRSDLEDVKDIMDAVGPHCKDMLLDVEVEVIGDWITRLDGTIVQTREVVCPRIDPRRGIDSDSGFGRRDSTIEPLSPTASDKSMDKLFRFYRLPTYRYSFKSYRTSRSMSDGEMDRDFAKWGNGRRSYLRASLLNLN